MSTGFENLVQLYSIATLATAGMVLAVYLILKHANK